MSTLVPAPNVPNPRNAGRKKSNPVWEFFTDLRVHGLAGVRCRFCHWVTNDRSPTTMKFHLKRKHDTGAGGLWALCEEKINQQAPPNYAPRKRSEPMRSLPSSSDSIFSRGFSLPQLLWKHFDPTLLLPSTPTATATIGVNAAQDEFLQNLIQQATNMASTSPPELREGLVKADESENLNIIETLLLSKLESCKNSDHSSDASFPTNLASPDFSLADGASIAGLLQIATDSDLTFTFNARRSGEYCFESNKGEKKGQMIVFSDHGTEIRVEQKVDGKEICVEMWRKSDWTQFCWAVRGTCLHFLKL
ncbi:unnamed protein product, partial [Mesorhabditis belari]|uniref:BED-type domain-containing protein n=1 Tax=Mesorhabditis belari TaxID=2138241 RepID=A0AAF3F2M2_9BILA